MSDLFHRKTYLLGGGLFVDIICLSCFFVDLFAFVVLLFGIYVFVCPNEKTIICNI